MRMPRPRPRALPLVALVLAFGLGAGPAAASPWTLARGELATVVRFDYESATEEFLDDADATPFSLNGRYQAIGFTPDIRLGLLDHLELEFWLPFKQVSYTADPVILLPAPEGGEGIDYYQENIIHLSRSVFGPTDLNLALRWQLLGGSEALALEGRLKAPTGYEAPQGTFGDRPRSKEAFLADVGRYVAPENVRDDVTLGDGQLDASLRLLGGAAFGTGTFVRLDAGYVLRMGGAADQVTGAVRAGQLLFGRLLPYAGVEADLAVERGRVIGVSVAAVDPELPAAEYGGTNNLELREVRLERDRAVVNFGAIFRITPEVELNLGHARTVWGNNTSAVATTSAGIGLRTRYLD
jgi:hypothetical protein